MLSSDPSLFSLALLSSERPKCLYACEQPSGGWQRKLICIRTVTHAIASRYQAPCSASHLHMKKNSCTQVHLKPARSRQALLISFVIFYLGRIISAAALTERVHRLPRPAAGCGRITCRVTHLPLLLKVSLQ